MTLQFLEVWGIDFNPVEEYYGFVDDRPDTVFYKILGAFFRDGKMATDGALVLSEEQLNVILERCPISLKLVKDNVGYTVSKTTAEERRLLNSLDYTVELIEIIEGEEEDDYVYGLVELEERNPIPQ